MLSGGTLDIPCTIVEEPSSVGGGSGSGSAHNALPLSSEGGCSQVPPSVTSAVSLSSNGASDWANAAQHSDGVPPPRSWMSDRVHMRRTFGLVSDHSNLACEHGLVSDLSDPPRSGPQCGQFSEHSEPGSGAQYGRDSSCGAAGWAAAAQPTPDAMRGHTAWSWGSDGLLKRGREHGHLSEHSGPAAGFLSDGADRSSVSSNETAAAQTRGGMASSEFPPAWALGRVGRQFTTERRRSSGGCSRGSRSHDDSRKGHAKGATGPRSHGRRDVGVYNNVLYSSDGTGKKGEEDREAPESLLGRKL
jgi:hypothetical protein